MSDPRDMTGVWYGRWDAADADVLPGTFIALVEERDGALAGSTSEPDDLEGGVLHALLSGARAGASVRWTKQYDGAGRLAHAVSYAGTVNDDATLVTGTWTLAGYRGGFAMQREKFALEELEDEAETGIPIGF